MGKLAGEKWEEWDAVPRLTPASDHKLHQLIPDEITYFISALSAISSCLRRVSEKDLVAIM